MHEQRLCNRYGRRGVFLPVLLHPFTTIDLDLQSQIPEKWRAKTLSKLELPPEAQVRGTPNEVCPRKGNTRSTYLLAWCVERIVTRMLLPRFRLLFLRRHDRYVHIHNLHSRNYTVISYTI